MSEFTRILSSQRMLSPFLLPILFWSGIGGVLYGTDVLLKLDNRASWLALVFGSLLTRDMFERAIISFRSYDRLVEIASSLDAMNGGARQ